MADDAKLAELETKLAEATASIDALTKKNRELLEEKRSTKTGAEAKLADLEAEVADLREAAKKNETAHKAAVEKLTKERDDLAKNLGETSAKARDYQTGVTLREALAKVGIGKLNAEDVTDAMGFVRSMIVYDDKGEAHVSFKDDKGKDVQQSLAEYVEKTYPTTSHAKRFIPADGNRGAGGGGIPRKPTGDNKKFSEMSLKERTELFKADPVQYKALEAAG